MLTGRGAFRGDSAVETMTRDPRGGSAGRSSSRPAVPSARRSHRIVRHCLEKNPEERFQSARDLAFDLEALSGVSTARLEASPLRARRRIRALPAALAIVVALAVGLLAGRSIWKTTPPAPPVFQRLTYGRGTIASARFAPDGQTIVYAAAWDGAEDPQLYSVRAESPESLRLGLPVGQVESISARGEMLLLHVLRYTVGYASTGTLSQVPLSGSAPRDLLDDVGFATWSPDGREMAVVRAPQWRYRLEFPVGKVLYETPGWISYPRVSPQGDAVAFLDHPILGDDRGAVALVDRAGKKTTLATGYESVQGLAWSPSGAEIWFTGTYGRGSRTLYAVTPSGRLRTVESTPSGMTLQDIARDGRVLFVEKHAQLGVLALPPGEAQERDLSVLDWAYGAILSADGKTLVVTEQGAAGGRGYTVYLRKTDGSPPVRLGEGGALALSPDGRWVLTALVREPPSQLVLLPTGAGQPRTFPKDDIEHYSGKQGAFLPDGKGVLFIGHEPGRPDRTFVQDLAGGAAKAITPEGVTGSVLAPDGETLVAETSDGLALVPLAGGPSRPLAGAEPGDQPLRFTADGGSLFVAEVDTHPARVDRLDLATGRRELWKEAALADPAGISMFNAAISADGETVLFGYYRGLSDLFLAEGME